MILVGDCIESMRGLPDASVQTCITSPPYFGLRDYGHDGQIGLEPTLDEFMAKLVAVFAEVRRVLRDDGTLWVNMGDTYATGTSAPSGASQSADVGGWTTRSGDAAGSRRVKGDGYKVKDLMGVPWRVAFALQADGWYLRQDIIWAKPNPMPESVRDRCTKSHEYLFLLSKGPRYFYDADAIAEPLAESSVERLLQAGLASQSGSERVPGKTNGAMKAVVSPENMNRLAMARDAYREQGLPDAPGATRNKRSVWTVATMPFKEAHFATFPEALIEPCILAGSKPGDVVLDPFGGAGTTGVVAQRMGRDFVLCELNPDYAAMAERRIRNTQPGLALDFAAA